MQESVLETYHSSFNSAGGDLALGIPLLPLNAARTTTDVTSTEGQDIVDEAIRLFRANVLFKNYKIEGPADRLIVFLTVFIQKCLQEMQRFPQKERAEQVVQLIVNDGVDPMSNTFFMRRLGLLPDGKSPAETAKCRDMLKKCMDLCAKRLLSMLYASEAGEMDRKFWLAFGKKTFLGQKFVDKMYSL